MFGAAVTEKVLEELRSTAEDITAGIDAAFDGVVDEYSSLSDL